MRESIFFGVAIAALAAQSPAHAAGCADYGAVLGLRHSLRLPAPGAEDVVATGGYAYIAAGSEGLTVVDLAEPPQVVGSADTPGWSGRLAVAAPFVYLAALSEIFVIDATDPSAPTLVTSFPTPGSAFDVAVEGQTLLVACGNAGLLSVDIANPAAPAPLDTLPGPSGAHYSCLSVENGIVCAGGSDLFIIDARDPRALTHLKKIFGDVNVVAQDAGLCYAGYYDLKIYDLTSPSAPTLEAEIDFPSAGVELCGLSAAKGRVYAFTSDVWGGTLHVVDVSNAAVPEVVGTWGTADYASAVSVDNARAYCLGGSETLNIVDVSNPSSMPRRGSENFPARNVASLGDRACVVAYDALRIVDLAASIPAILGATAWPSPFLPLDVVIEGHHAFVVGETSLHVADVAVPSAPVVVASVPGFAGVRVANSGATLYVASDNTVQILDIQQPTAPVLLGEISFPQPIYSVAVGGGHAYLRTEWVVYIVDVSDASAPHLVNTIDGASSVAIQGNFAYLGGTERGFEILDVSNPESPTSVGEMPLSEVQFDIAIRGECAYLACYSAGVLVVDISDPAHPRLIGGLNTPGEAWDLALTAQGVCVADFSSIQVAPFQCRDWDPIVNTVAFDPAVSNPLELGQPTPLGNGRILQLQAAGPNPFRSETMVSFALSRDARVRVGIYDVTGRLLRSLLDRTLPSGPHDVVWDGRSSGGARAVPGVYFVRMDAMGETISHRVVSR